MVAGADAGVPASSSNGAPAPALPALARIRHDLHWPDQQRKHSRFKPEPSHGRQSSSEGSQTEARTPGSAQAVVGPSSSQSPTGAGSPRQQHHHTGSSITASATRRLGALGIPISSSEGGDDDDDEDMDVDEADTDGMKLRFVPSVVMSSDSLEGNPPGSPAVPIVEPPAATYSRGGSTRSPSTRSGEDQEAGAFVSEESFRDIVDELTLQNQRLKQRLKRFESARVPNNLRNERLFEIRFFDGLPKQRRREIESFLTDYVQTFSSSGDHGSSSSSRINVTGGSSTQDHTETTSSIGATLRSLRSSEKELLAKEAMAAALQGASASAGRAASASGSGSGSGSGAAARKTRDRRTDSVAAMEPLGSVLSPAAALPDPPPLLRRPTDIFPPERDVLAAPSFSGPEPRSLTGTGSGMRISDPTSKKRRRTPVAPTAPPSPERTSRLRQTASFDGSLTSESVVGTPDPERLEGLVVEMLERLFYECLPVEGAEEVSLPPANPLHSDPQPLPPQSSTNTQYLRTMLFSEETQKSGGYLYLNLLGTMAGLHRLNVSVGTVRHALRTKSHLIEVSAEGNKVRWKGPLSKPRPEPDDVARPELEMGDMEDNSIEATRMEGVEQAERRRDVRERLRAPTTTLASASKEDATSTRSSGDQQNSRFDSRHGATTHSGSGQDPSRSKGSTAPTSLMPSGSGGGSKNGSSSISASRGSGEAQMNAHSSLAGRNQPASASALRHTVEELSSAGAGPPGEGVASVDALGSVEAAPPVPKRVLYTPLFVRRNDPASDAESKDDDIMSDKSAGSLEGQERPAKRRKDYEGGVVFFANDLFYSDLAGDIAARTSRLKEALRDDSLSFQAILGDSSSVEAEGSSRTGSAGAGTSLLSRSRSSASPAVADSSSGLSLPKPLGVRLDEGKSSTGASVDAMSATSSVSPGDDLDVDFTSWDAIDHLDIAPSSHNPHNPTGEHDIFRITPKPSLKVSAMHDVIAADHFTMHVKLLYPRRELASSSRIRAPLSKGARPVHAPVVPASFASQQSAASTASYWPIHLVTHTLNHHPSVRVRFPRLRLRESSVSDTDGEIRSAGATGSASPTSSQLRRLPPVPGVDYFMSLSLPLNAWAPETRRPSESDERATDLRSRTGTCSSLIVVD